ncbi:MAG: hypothetical protein WCI88_01585 [Chloroflexota bacterium]|jgi:hypothetical protein
MKNIFYLCLTVFVCLTGIAFKEPKFNASTKSENFQMMRAMPAPTATSRFPSPTPAKENTPPADGFVTYQDPNNLYFVSVPETAKKLPGDRPTVFQLKDNGILMIFQKEYAKIPNPDELQDLVDGILYIYLDQEKLADSHQISLSEKIQDDMIFKAKYSLAGQEKGNARFTLMKNKNVFLGIGLISPGLLENTKIWDNVIKSFKLVDSISTPVAASNELQPLSFSGGEIKTLPDAVRDIFQVSQGTYFVIDDFDYSLAQMGKYKAFGTGQYPKDFIIRSKVSWRVANGAVTWDQAGCGYVFRYMDKNNFYAIYWGLDGKTYLNRVTQGEKISVYYGFYPEKNLARGEGEIMFSISGNQINAFFNGKRVYRTVDSPLSSALASGETGLAVFSGTNADYGVRCRFSNNELWVVKQP